MNGDGPAATGRDKTSLVFATAHRAGALHEALTPLHTYGVNMSMIHSRPVPGRMWEYVFFVDVEGHQKDEHVTRAVDELRGLASSLSILGSYPAAGWEAPEHPHP
jgi:chorismate mutase/prephenate dehydratase